PMAHKDMYYRQGRVSACGSKLRADWRAPFTATALQRLDQAGALDIGRLLMVEVAMGPHGYNPNYPQCRNPWNPDHIPSGSSSSAPLPTIGIARGYFDTGVHPDVAKAHDQAADDLRRAGFIVKDVALPPDLLDEIAELHPLVMKSEGAANHTPTMREHEPDYT